MIQEYWDEPLVFVHNHPNLTDFSINDLREFLSVPNIKILIAIGNDGIISYIVKTNDMYDYNITKRIIDNKYNKSKNWDSIYNDLIKHQDNQYLKIKHR